jgi:hypothetical protein
VFLSIKVTVAVYNGTYIEDITALLHRGLELKCRDVLK